jgi:hypothetical protein
LISQIYLPAELCQHQISCQIPTDPFVKTELFYARQAGIGSAVLLEAYVINDFSDRQADEGVPLDFGGTIWYEG